MFTLFITKININREKKGVKNTLTITIIYHGSDNYIFNVQYKTSSKDDFFVLK